MKLLTTALFAALTLPPMSGCVAHKIYNPEPEQYISAVTLAEHPKATADLAIIEFDEHGMFWDRQQLDDTVELIRQRNAEQENGIIVLVFVHGWKNNADPNFESVPRFRRRIEDIMAEQARAAENIPRHVVGVFIGWRGRSSALPIQGDATFWGRQAAAQRMVSYNTREAFFRLADVTDERHESTCAIVGHSMGGLIVGKTLGPALTTLLLRDGREGVEVSPEIIVLENPALDALASYQLVDFLKRSNARVKLRSQDGELTDADVPIIVSVTSEADKATGSVYPLGRTMQSLNLAFRRDSDLDTSQRKLFRRAEGHVEQLISHRAWIEDGEIKLEAIEDRWNDTPFWIVRVSKDISANHGDVANPRFRSLIKRLYFENEVFDPEATTVIFADVQPDGGNVGVSR